MEHPTQYDADLFRAFRIEPTVFKSRSIKPDCGGWHGHYEHRIAALTAQVDRWQMRASAWRLGFVLMTTAAAWGWMRP